MNRRRSIERKYCILWCAIFLTGVFLRTWELTKYPMGVNADEAYAGYEAYALLKAGVDSHGYRFPVYFISWGSGMNILYSVLSIPFQWIGGFTLYTVRLPQAVLGSVSLIVFYCLLKEIQNERMALLGMLLLAVNPWHIMMCRWGLESNLAPAMLLFAFYFMVKAYQGRKSFYFVSFLFFGLALYAYAVMWIFVPLALLFLIVWGIRQDRLHINRWLLSGCGILVILGMPLVLFLLVNKGVLPEIITSFFSIPRMDSIRSSEISPHDIPQKVWNLLYFLTTQVDRDIFNTSNVGIYYFCSIPFFIVGFGKSVFQFWKNQKERKYQPADVMMVWFASAFCVGCVISYVNVNKINCIHLPVIYYSVYGLDVCVSKWGKWLCAVTVTAYTVLFGMFCLWYYDEDKIYFYYGYEEALDYAKECTDGEIGVVMVRYSNLLMYSKMLPQVYLEENERIKNYDEVEYFGRYQMNPSPEEMNYDMVYVVPKISVESYLKEGYTVRFDNGYYVVIAGEEVPGGDNYGEERYND